MGLRKKVYTLTRSRLTMRLIQESIKDSFPEDSSDSRSF